MYYDMHCHLDTMDDSGVVIQRAKNAGVGFILVNGTDPESNVRCLKLAEEHAIVHAALGLYPNDALKLSPEELDAAIDQIRQNDPVAIGEVGLDYHWDKEHKEEMKLIFSKILDLAEELQKPVIIHSRKAEKDVIEMLEARPNITACLHCFGGSLKLAKRAAERGCYFSIPATIVKSTHFQRLVEEIPFDRLLTETDSPWLSPDDNKNEPKNVVLVAQNIAEMKGISVENASTTLFRNLEAFIKNHDI